MIILGIDPGSQKTGYGVIQRENNRLKRLSSGQIKLSPKLEFSEKLATITTSLNQVIEEFTPESMAVEKVFLSKNVHVALVLGQARGAAIVAGALKGMKVYEYAARQVKTATVGFGAADKEQVRHMVGVLLQIPYQQLKEDEADALAVAITHAHTVPPSKI